MLLFRKKLLSLPCIYRLLSTQEASASLPPPLPTSHFAVQYLSKFCGLTSDEAIRAAKGLRRLRSPAKPDAVLQFLRQAGVAESDIRAAALRYPSFLRLSVEECLKPRIAELQQIGFSPSQISLLLSIYPRVFACPKLQQNIVFLTPIFGSIEKLLSAFSRHFFLLTVNLENSAVTVLSFFKDQCCLSACQISRAIQMAPRLITSKPEAVEMFAKRAEDLGIPKSSAMFMYALVTVSCVRQSTIDARLLHLRSFGFSQEAVTLMIQKNPQLLGKTEELIGRKMEFLMKKAGCDKSDVVLYPALLNLSLEKRLIPRSLVQKHLKSKGFLVANRPFASFAIPSEKRFIERFVLPYEDTIPGIHRTYIDACSGKTSGFYIA